MSLKCISMPYDCPILELVDEESTLYVVCLRFKVFNDETKLIYLRWHYLSPMS